MAVEFFAGCIGGVAGVFVGHPFDTIKVRLQTQSYLNPKYRGSYDVFRFIVRNESVRGLYKGVTSPLYGLAAINTVLFGVQANLQRQMNNPDALSSYFFTGAFAGLCQCVVCSPQELAKTLMQTQGEGKSYKTRGTSHEFKGPWDCLKKIYKQDGIRGVSRGGLLTALRDTPAFGIYFLIYEYICRKLDKPDGSQLATWALLLAGGLSGMGSWISTYPIDVIKTRVQNDTKHEYNGAWDCCKKTYRAEGLSAFSRGLGATMLRAFPVNAATFATVAWVLRLANQGKDQDDATIPLSSLSPDISKFPKHYFPHSHVLSSVITNFPSHHG